MLLLTRSHSARLHRRRFCVRLRKYTYVRLPYRFTADMAFRNEMCAYKLAIKV